MQRTAPAPTSNNPRPPPRWIWHAVLPGRLQKGLARPILIARPHVLAERLEKSGLRIKPHRDFELLDPSTDPRIEGYWKQYYQIMQRKGISQAYATREASRRTTLIGALMVKNDDADAMLCGTIANFDIHLRYIN